MHNRYLWIVALIMCAFAIRIYHLDAVPLRGDEAYSVLHWTAPPFSERWERLIRDEPAPVGAFTLYWLWNTFTGDSVFATRYLSLLGNVLGTAAMIVLAKRLLKGWRLGLLAGLLWTVHPYLIWHAQDARVYGVLSALTTLAFYWLIRARWRPYIVVQTAAVYLYYLEPFWLVAHGLYILTRRDAKLLRHAITAWFIIGLLSIPVIAQLYHLMFVSQYQGNAASADFPAFFSEFIPTLLFGDNIWPLPLGVIVALLLFVGLMMVYRKDRATAAVALLWIFVPALLLYAASFASDFFRPRYITTVIPALILALVAIPAYFHRTAVLMIAAFICFVSLVEVRDYYFYDPPKAADWPGLMGYLRARTSPEDVLLSGAVDPALEYYYTGPADIVFIPQDEPDPASYLPALLDDYSALFLLSGERTGEVGQYLQANAQHIPGDIWPGIVQYRRWDVHDEEIEHPLAVNFGDVALLRGYTLLDNTTLILYWEALAQTASDHSVLLHINPSPDAAPQAVLDHGIAGAVVSTRTWQPGLIYRDPVALPQNLPLKADEFIINLAIGLYETETGQRLKSEEGQEVYSIDTSQNGNR